MATNKYIIQLIVDTGSGEAKVKGVAKAFEDLDTSAKRVKTSIDRAKDSTDGLGGAAGIAGAATAEFGRLISDLPYGITAVTNNLSQLGSMFALLVTSAGGVRKAIGAMIKVMSGPTGVLIAFQAVVAAIDYFSRSAKKASEEANKLNQALSGIQPRIAEMEALADVVDKGNGSIIEQRIALEKLKKLGYDPLNESLEDFKKNYIEIITLQATKDVFGERVASIVKERLELEDEIKRLREAFTDDETFIEKVLGMINIPVKEARQAIQAMKIELSPKALAELDNNLEEELQRYADVVNQILKSMAKGSAEGYKDAELTGKKMLQLIVGKDLWESTKTDAIEFAKDVLNESADAAEKELKKRVDSTGERNWFVDTFGVSKDKVKNTLDQLQQGLNAAFDLIDAQMGRELALEESKTIMLNDQLRARLRNEQLTADARDKINQEIAKNDAALVEKQNEIEEKRFKLNKAQGIANAFINTAVAVTDVLPNVPLAAFIGALGAAQIAAIASQKFVPTASPSPSLTGQGAASSGGDNVFNVVGASQQTQIAEAIAGSENKPVKAYVVSSDVTSAQELDRRIVEGASI